jgi:hypothetical protein
LDNNLNAVIEAAYPYGDINNIAYAIGNGTDVVSWEYGKEGNYWSDYQLKYPNATEIEGMWDIPYVIDENNVDHYPLNQQVDIFFIAPNPTHVEPTVISISTIAVFVSILIIVGLLAYFKKNKNKYSKAEGVSQEILTNFSKECLIKKKLIEHFKLFLDKR